MRITLTLPDRIASSLLTLVQPGERSALVSKLLEAELEQRKKKLIAACQKASFDKKIEEVVDDWQSFDEKVDGDW